MAQIATTRRRFLAAASMLPLFGSRSIAKTPARDGLRVGLYSGVFTQAENTPENLESAKILAEVGFRQYNCIRVRNNKIAQAVDFFHMMNSQGLPCGLQPEWMAFQDTVWNDGTAERGLTVLKPLDGLASDIYLGHEVFEWANRALRRDIVAKTKRALPNTPTRMYFARLNIPETKKGQFNRHGGLWDDYAIVDRNEPDIIHFSMGDSTVSTADAFKRFDDSCQFLNKIDPARPKYCHINFTEEAIASEPGRSDMKRVVDHVRAGGGDVLLLRAIDPSTKDKVRPSALTLKTLGGIIRA